jgi:hypothetical protein
VKEKMSEEDFVKVNVDEETYGLLEKEGKKHGLTVDEYVVKLIHDMYDAVMAEKS